jgi:hypothetical protein
MSEQPMPNTLKAHYVCSYSPYGLIELNKVFKYKIFLLLFVHGQKFFAIRNEELLLLLFNQFEGFETLLVLL